MACKIVNSSLKLLIQSNLRSKSAKTNLGALCRYSSYQNTKDISEFRPALTEYEVSKSKTEWQFVERLIAPLTVPQITEQKPNNTIWKPPTAKPGEHKYFVSRNRNHLIPVYMSDTHRGMRKLTELKKIHGDIHVLDRDLREIIQRTTGKPVASQVNELVGCIRFKGDYVRIIQQYLLEKGF